MKLTLISKQIFGIPVLELFAENVCEKRPLVIMMHGLAARKENVLPYAYFVAQEGYHAILFDAHDHGELETAQFKKASDSEKKAHMFTVIFETSKNIDKIIKAFAQSQSVDFNRVGLIGFSMGGMIIYDYLCQRSSAHVKTVVAIIATPEWGGSVRRGVVKDSDYAKYFDEKKIRLIEDRQPANHLSTLKDFPLLILNGELDEIMPIGETKSFYQQARQNYTQPGLIRLIEYAGIGHTPTFEMLSEAIVWLKRYL